jgi:hypothetical protein
VGGVLQHLRMVLLRLVLGPAFLLLLLRLVLHPAFLLFLGARVNLLLSHQLLVLRPHPRRLCVRMALYGLLLTQLFRELSFCLLQCYA